MSCVAGALEALKGLGVLGWEAFSRKIMTRIPDSATSLVLHGVFQEAWGPVKICRSGGETVLKNALNIL